jgi:SAM-dependent methyltransferase
MTGTKATVFDAYAREYGFWMEHINPPRYHETLGSFLPDPVTHALDAGCGPGHLALYLADRAKKVIGVDLSRPMIALAKQRQAKLGKNNISFLVTDLSRVPFEPGTFDFIGGDCVLHDTSLDVTLPALRRLLKPGGRIFVRDLVTRAPSKSTSPLWQGIWAIRRIPRYTRHFGLRDMLRLVSFEVNPAWLRQRCKSENTTPEAFRASYSRLLPGCRFVDYEWAMAVFWEAPAGP